MVEAQSHEDGSVGEEGVLEQLSIFYYPLYIICYLLSVMKYPLSINPNRYPLSIIRYLISITYHPLSIIYYPNYPLSIHY